MKEEYWVIFMTNGTTERIDCTSKEHAQAVYDALRDDMRKAIRSRIK